MTIEDLHFIANSRSVDYTIITPEDIRKLSQNVKSLEKRFEAYQHCVNRIDDHFEYLHGTQTDKIFVRSELEKLTNKLKK